MRIVKPEVSLEWITHEPLKAIERAGRTCYKSEELITPDSSKAFVKKIQGLGHESVIEHGVASFRIICDRGVTHEIVRHRLASYSQESTRYCNYGKGKFGMQITVIEPPYTKPTSKPRWERVMRVAEEEYLAMIKEGESPQIARSVLPNSLKTEIVMTANFREWIHFLKLRTSAAAHPQMREVANQIQLILEACVPEVFTKRAPSVTLNDEEAAAIKSYLLASGMDAEVNGALTAAFKSACAKLGAK